MKIKDLIQDLNENYCPENDFYLKIRNFDNREIQLDIGESDYNYDKNGNGFLFYDFFDYDENWDNYKIPEEILQIEEIKKARNAFEKAKAKYKKVLEDHYVYTRAVRWNARTNDYCIM